MVKNILLSNFTNGPFFISYKVDAKEMMALKNKRY